MNRYDVNSPEGDFQPGSDHQVLRNLLGITSPEEMDEVELGLLAQLYENVLVVSLPERVLTVEDIKTWHRRWLGHVYEWAGRERSVNLGKGGFAFAAAAQIPRLLAQFERDCLQRWTPCQGLNTEELVRAMAVTHVELILIHPFREGNGRLSRLLADVMALQAGRDPLDYSAWETNKDAYIAAIHQGVQMNFEPMKHWIRVAMGLAENGLTPPV